MFSACLFAPTVFSFVWSYMFVCLLIYLFSCLFFVSLLFIFLSDVFSSRVWSSLSSCRILLFGVGVQTTVNSLVSKATRAIDSYRRPFARWKKFSLPRRRLSLSCEDGTCSFVSQHFLDPTQSHSIVDSAIYAIQ